jgi:long-subunit fatty acid transport protein
MLFLTNQKGAAQVVHGKADVWTSLITNYQINEKWSIGNELHFRMDNWVTEPEQFLIRPSVSYQIKPKLKASLGYTYVHTFPYGDFALPAERPEHNVWEQISLSQKIGKVGLTHRYRLEQRFQSLLDPTQGKYSFQKINFAHRFRYRLTIKIPLYKTLFLNAFDELWIGASNDFKEIAFDRNWFYAGLGWQATDYMSLQLGYLHQYVQNNPNRFERHHTVQLTLKFVFKGGKEEDKK